MGSVAKNAGPGRSANTGHLSANGRSTATSRAGLVRNLSLKAVSPEHLELGAVSLIFGNNI